MNDCETLKLYLDTVDCAIQVSPGDDEEVALDKKGEIEHHDAIVKILKLYLGRVDHAIQACPGEDLEKETATDINMKSSESRESQEKLDVNINITITPGSSSPIIDIKFNTTEINIRKRRSSEEPVGESKGKCARSVVVGGFCG
jgi:hypothetical protein